MRRETARLSRVQGFNGMTDDHLAALLVGRWQSGAPVSRVPSADDPALGGDELANNSFRFDSPGRKYRLAGGKTDTFPVSVPDPIGQRCPLAAHIRKVNVRDSASDVGARSATYTKRVLRVGVPYGKSIANRYGDGVVDDEDRGLLFLSIQSSIEQQFEFLQARWMNDTTRPKDPAGNDMLVGQNAPAADGVRRCMLFGAGNEIEHVEANKQWVTATGGGYFFVPSLSALRQVVLVDRSERK
jgi:Dyp-type peroxidase family